MKSNLAKKTTEQCFLGKTKPTCQNLAIFEHFQNNRKIKGTFLPAAFQLLNRCLVTNSFLNKIGIIPSPACSFCGEMNKSLEHFFNLLSLY